MKSEYIINGKLKEEDMQFFSEKLRIIVQFLCLQKIYKLFDQKGHMFMSHFYLLMGLISKFIQLAKIIHMLKLEDPQHLEKRFNEMKKVKKLDIQ